MLAVATVTLVACTERGRGFPDQEETEVGASEGTAEAEDTAEAEEHEAEEHYDGIGVSVELADGWREADEEIARVLVPEAATMYVNPATCTERFCANLNTLVIPVPNADLQSFHEQTLHEFTELLGGDILRQEQVDIDGHDGYEIEFVARMMQNELHGLQRYALVDDKAVVVTFTSRRESFDEQLGDGEAMLDSVAVVDTGDSIRGCDELATIIEGRRETPEPGTKPHPWATGRSQTPVDPALVGLLLDTVDHGTYTHTHEDVWDLDGHDASQHNPAARDLAARHGFVREVRRQWTDEDGNAVVHTTTQLSSPANAESFDVHVARYSCRFAEEVWPVPFDDRHPPGIGQRILYGGGAVTEQIAWTRDGRRHVLAVSDQKGDPSRELLERLVGRAHPLDDGADILSEASSPTGEDPD